MEVVLSAEFPAQKKSHRLTCETAPTPPTFLHFFQASERDGAIVLFFKGIIALRKRLLRNKSISPGRNQRCNLATFALSPREHCPHVLLSLSVAAPVSLVLRCHVQVTPLTTSAPWLSGFKFLQPQCPPKSLPRVTAHATSTTQGPAPAPMSSLLVGSPASYRRSLRGSPKISVSVRQPTTCVAPLQFRCTAGRRTCSCLPTAQQASASKRSAWWGPQREEPGTPPGVRPGLGRL